MPRNSSTSNYAIRSDIPNDFKDLMRSQKVTNILFEDDKVWRCQLPDGKVLVVFKERYIEAHHKSTDKLHLLVKLECQKELCAILHIFGFSLALDDVQEIAVYNAKLYFIVNPPTAVPLHTITGDSKWQTYSACTTKFADFDVAKLSVEGFGLIKNFQLFPPYKRCASWQEFLHTSFVEMCRLNAENLHAQGLSIDEALQNLFLVKCQDFFTDVRLQLVHGKLTPEACLVAPDDHAHLHTILNFGELSMWGDPLLDVAGQLFFMETFDDPDRAVSIDCLHKHAIDHYGEEIYARLNLYRIFYALLMLTDQKLIPQTCPAEQTAKITACALLTLKKFAEILESTMIWQIMPVLSLSKSKPKSPPKAMTSSFVSSLSANSLMDLGTQSLSNTSVGNMLDAGNICAETTPTLR